MEDLDLLVNSAQAGHRDARETIIQRLKPLVVKTAVSLSGRYIDLSNDEMSIGLLAIDQAIDKYQPTGGANFISYTELIVKRRLIDYYRREQRINQDIPFSSLVTDRSESDDQPLAAIEHQQAMADFQKAQEEEERREEIKNFAGRLQTFGISFTDLVQHSPKHEDARVRAMAVAKQVAANPDWVRHLQDKKELPLKQIELGAAVSRKTLERQRKYIIGMTLVFLGDYHYLRAYIEKAL